MSAALQSTGRGETDVVQQPIPTLGEAELRAATITVCACATDADDARMLMDMLGLTPGGTT